MANIIYLSLSGDKQGLISAGCSTMASVGNLHQSGHEDEIFVYELNTSVTREDNIACYPLQIRKPIDKSTPLLSQALGDKEVLTCTFSLYRTAMAGGNECYFKIKLLGGLITDINAIYPNSLTHNDLQPSESLSFKFNTIEWEHVTARTSSYLFWQDTVI
ncbi:Hcp family type VI secretion system effector [Pectobacterium cacticida]|uniref:Hcp family type VI secretion system effector n=1 Tax=Pectobacterium cacticida TaxID=69221 RepID=A0ABZ2G8Q0_9GAMM|nr:Hcp family type VI secretion system effector [Pectobacterium cacticida]UYX08039.1 Hcp family type VI secretion system effector [Pectobacterium cacticida]